ncbi:hypothetical protein JZU54_02490, partial [bacterium]|nr:hypothetical protein [bacterium]
MGGDGGTLTDTTDVAQSDLLITGNLVLQTTAGSILVGEGDTDAGTLGILVTNGQVLLKAAGIGADVQLDADVILTNGRLSL